MTLVKTSLMNGIAVAIRILTMLMLNKILAVYIGPTGYAVIGQFQNFVNLLTTVASGAFNTGVAKHTAEYFDDVAQQVSVWKTAGTIALLSSLGIGIVISILHRPLAGWILRDESMGGVFVWLGIGLVFFTLNNLLLAILNGKKEINRYVFVNISGSLVGLLVTGGLATWCGLYGALIALAINQSIVFCVTFALCSRNPWFRLDNLVGRVDPIALRILGRFTIMAITSAACVSLSQILIRNHLGTFFGWEAAGYWEALMRISGLCLMAVTTPLAVYYLPRLSEIRNNSELKREILLGYRLILPIAIIGALGIFLIRDWLVATMFTAKFAPMRDLFAWQMVGDVLKIGSWLLAHLLIARALTKIFILTEIGFSVSFVASTIFLTSVFGVQGVTISYAINYAIYWIYVALIINRQVFAGAKA